MSECFLEACVGSLEILEHICILAVHVPEGKSECVRVRVEGRKDRREEGWKDRRIEGRIEGRKGGRKDKKKKGHHTFKRT